MTWAWAEISSSYVNLGLSVAIFYLLYKILFQASRFNFNLLSYLNLLPLLNLFYTLMYFFHLFPDPHLVQKEQEEVAPPEPTKPPVKKQDMTLQVTQGSHDILIPPKLANSWYMLHLTPLPNFLFFFI